MQDIIENLLRETKREGIEDLIAYLVDEGFFEAPASTKFHGSYKGGLAKHSLGVYDMFIKILPNTIFEVASTGQKPLLVTDIEATTAIVCLLHDVCKIGQYLGDAAPYKWNKANPKGHATLSIERIKKFIKLEPLEEMMIRYHMGIYGLNEFYEMDSWEYKSNAEYPLRGDHTKDEGMTKEESQAVRYGKSLRNAWYHNPICKIMYFADELATLNEKAEN